MHGDTRVSTLEFAATAGGVQYKGNRIFQIGAGQVDNVAKLRSFYGHNDRGEETGEDIDAGSYEEKGVTKQETTGQE